MLDIKRMEHPTMKHVTIAVLLLSAFLVGCVSPRAVMIDDTKRQPTTSIEVFREGNKPNKAYKEIAEISCNTWSGADAQALKALLTKAKKMGANAIITSPSQGTGYTFNPFGRSGNKSVWKAVAVVYE